MLTIGKLAAAGNVSADALRYYERERLLAPAAKTQAGYRMYGEDAARRVGFIRHAQACGFTLAEIRELLQLRQTDGARREDVRRRAVEKKLQLADRIRAMQVMAAALDRLIAECAGGAGKVEDCPILIALEQVEFNEGRLPRKSKSVPRVRRSTGSRQLIRGKSKR